MATRLWRRVTTRKGVAVFSTPVLKDARKVSKDLGKGFYVRSRWFGGWSVFGPRRLK